VVLYEKGKKGCAKRYEEWDDWFMSSAKGLSQSMKKLTHDVYSFAH